MQCRMFSGILGLVPTRCWQHPFPTTDVSSHHRMSPAGRLATTTTRLRTTALHLFSSHATHTAKLLLTTPPSNLFKTPKWPQFVSPSVFYNTSPAPRNRVILVQKSHLCVYPSMKYSEKCLKDTHSLKSLIIPENIKLGMLK